MANCWFRVKGGVPVRLVSLAPWASSERVVDRSAHACFARTKHWPDLGSARRSVVVRCARDRPCSCRQTRASGGRQGGFTRRDALNRRPLDLLEGGRQSSDGSRVACPLDEPHERWRGWRSLSLPPGQAAVSGTLVE